MQKRILVVDDAVDILEVTKVRLEKAGYEVFTVETGEAAMAFLQNTIPDLILLDMILPEMQGEDVCKQIKQSPILKNIPIVLFTASITNIEQKTQTCKANDYIMKPYAWQELLKKVKALIPP